MEKIIDLRKTSSPVPESGPKNNPPSPSHDKPSSPRLISWIGPIYYHEPDMKLVWIFSIGFWVLAALFQIFQKNSITTTLMALIGLIIIFQAKKKHKNQGEIVISPKGVKVAEKNFLFPQIKSFWVDYQPELGVEELSIQLNKWYAPYVRVPINGRDPVQIRSFLIEFIPEVQHEISLGEVIARRLGL